MCQTLNVNGVIYSITTEKTVPHMEKIVQEVGLGIYSTTKNDFNHT